MLVPWQGAVPLGMW